MQKNALYSAIFLVSSALTVHPLVVGAQPMPPSPPNQPSAPSELIDATDPEKIFEMAKSYGASELKKDSDGDPLILGNIDGIKYGILFYGCKNGKDCDDIQFYASWSTKVSLERINRWNQTKRYGKAYIDTDGEPGLKMIVNIDYGVSTENLKDSFNWWQRVVKDFDKEMSAE